MCFILGSMEFYLGVGILLKDQQNKHYGHIQAHPLDFSDIQKGKNHLK